MAHCPYCEEWHYDPFGAPVVAKQIGQWLPVVYVDGELRQARMSEAPNGYTAALGAHICEKHWQEPDVIRLGPVKFEFFGTTPAPVGYV